MEFFLVDGHVICRPINTMPKRTHDEAQPKLKLYYFDIQGKAEAIRLLCKYVGLELDDYRFKDRSEFMEMKQNGTLAFGQVPMLEIDGTKKLPQSAAILRYLAKMGGIHPEEDYVAALVDAALDQEADAFLGPTVASYTTRFGIALDEAHTAAASKLIGEETMPRHLAALEALLAQSSTGWLAGTKEPAACDFAWACRLGQYLPFKDRMFPTPLRELQDYPKCKAFKEKFFELPEIAAYYKTSAL